MLRNTGDGNELALPATNTYGSIVSVLSILYGSRTDPVSVHGMLACLAWVALVSRRPLDGLAALAIVLAEPMLLLLPFGGYAGRRTSSAESST